MKWIHTSDWHLGKLLKGQSLTEDQEWLLKNQFLPLVDEEKPDVILLAGDVYDRSNPPGEAVELFDEITEEIVGVRKIPMIIISGNHDSAERLSVGSRLLKHEGLYIFGPLERVKPVILGDAHGDIAFCPLPYGEPARVRVMMNTLGLPGAEDIHTFEDAERALSAYVLSMVPQGKIRKVAVAHTFAAGAQTSDSERPLSIGGTDRVDISVFDPYDYTALGHLHRPQKLGEGNIRYAGSLMRYSFGEDSQEKGAIVCEMDGGGKVSCTFRPLVPKRQVRRIKGLFKDIMEREDPSPDDYVEATLLDREPVIDAMPKIRRKYPHALGVIQDLGWKDAGDERKISLETMSDMDILNQFTSQSRDYPLSEEEIRLAESCWKAVQEKESGK